MHHNAYGFCETQPRTPKVVYVATVMTRDLTSLHPNKHHESFVDSDKDRAILRAMAALAGWTQNGNPRGYWVGVSTITERAEKKVEYALVPYAG